MPLKIGSVYNMFWDGTTLVKALNFDGTTVTEDYGTGDAVTVTFTLSSLNYEIYVKNTIDIQNNGTSINVASTNAAVEVLSTSPNVGSGTFTRATGALSFTFLSAPSSGAVLTISYKVSSALFLGAEITAYNFSDPFLKVNPQYHYSELSNVPILLDDGHYLDDGEILDTAIKKIPTNHLSIELLANQIYYNTLDPAGVLKYLAKKDMINYIIRGSEYTKKATEIPHVGCQLALLTDRTGFYDTFRTGASSYTVDILETSFSMTSAGYGNPNETDNLDVFETLVAGVGPNSTMYSKGGAPGTITDLGFQIYSKDLTLAECLDVDNIYYPNSMTGITMELYFNNNVRDTKANSVVNYGATFVTDRFLNATSSASFNGSSQYILAAPYSILSNKGSISFWFKPHWNSASASNYTFFAQRLDIGSTKYLHIAHSTTNTWLVGWNTTSDGRMTINDSAFPVTSGYWYHIVFTWDDSTGVEKFYFNNVLKATGAVDIGSIVYTAGGAINIGKFISGGNYYDGEIDDIRTFNRVITTAEINTLYLEDAWWLINSFIPTGTVQNFVFATGNGTTYSWSGNLVSTKSLFANVIPGTLSLTFTSAALVYTVSDDSFGSISALNTNFNGTIDYDTGDYVFNTYSETEIENQLVNAGPITTIAGFNLGYTNIDLSTFYLNFTTGGGQTYSIQAIYNSPTSYDLIDINTITGTGTITSGGILDVVFVADMTNVTATFTYRVYSVPDNSTNLLLTYRTTDQVSITEFGLRSPAGVLQAYGTTLPLESDGIDSHLSLELFIKKN